MRSVVLLLTVCFFGLLSGQEKKNFSNTESLLKGIQADKGISAWILISTNYGRDTVLKTYGKTFDYNHQDAGFQIIKNEDQYYYYAFSKNGKIEYATDIASLKSFLGDINSPEEAALYAIFDGYLLDEEFKHLAGNYAETKDKYIIELAKVTSEKCPFAKTHYEITFDKKTGKVIAEKDRGVYSEVFDKSCENNPHYSDLVKQMDDAKAKKEQDVIEHKEAKAKAKKKLMKSMKGR